MLNILKVLVLTPRENYWYYPYIKGVAPTPRYGHSMAMNENLDILVIVGGKNDDSPQTNEQNSLNYISVLNLQTMVWTSSLTFGTSLIIPRYFHASVIFEDKMIVFGGVEPSSYAKDDIMTVEMSKSFFIKTTN